MGELDSGRKVESFRDLVAWQKGMALVRVVYEQTAHLPPDGRFGLIQQMRRAAVSVPSNRAEGHCRSQTRDYLRFVRMARGSVGELSTQAEVCVMLGYAGDWNILRERAEEVRRILTGLIRSLEARLS